MRTLGMIGGTSWHSTTEYYKLINQGVNNRIGKQGNPPLILHSINVEIMRRQDIDEINAKYLDVSQKLYEAGAEGIIICANTPHQAYDFVQPKITIPILHIADAIGIEAQNQNLGILGLLGTKPTMIGDFIPKILKQKYGIKTIIPESEELDNVHNYIADELTQGNFTQEARQYYETQIMNMKNKGAEGIILGCTELPILFGKETSSLALLDTLQLHTRMAVNFILS